MVNSHDAPPLSVEWVSCKDTGAGGEVRSGNLLFHCKKAMFPMVFSSLAFLNGRCPLMRSLRIIAVVLFLWAVLATAYTHVPLGKLLGLPSEPRPAYFDNKVLRGEKMVAIALAAAVACMVVDSLVRLGKRTVSSNAADQDDKCR